MVGLMFDIEAVLITALTGRSHGAVVGFRGGGLSIQNWPLIRSYSLWLLGCSQWI